MQKQGIFQRARQTCARAQRCTLGMAAMLAALAVAAPARHALAAGEIKIRIGTLAPDGSLWHKHLRSLADEWAKASDNKIKVTIFPGGVVGNEADMVKKLKIKSLQGALLTGTGIRDIDGCVQGLQVPMMLRNNEELDDVMEKMSPSFEKKLEAKGYVVLHWGDAGWVTFFTQKPAKTPADMKNQKVFAWAGDEQALEAWKLAGFSPVVLSATDITMSLQTGMIQAVDTTPLAALSFQWHRHAPYMTDAKWAPLVGALFLSKETWEKIPADLRPKLMQIARDAEKKIRVEGRKLASDAIATMTKDGMKVVTLSAADHAAWQAAAEKAYPLVRGKVVPADVFDEVKKLRDEFVAKKKK